MDTDKSVDPSHKKIRSRLRAKEYHLFSAMPPLEAVKALVSIMVSVGWSSKGKPLKLRHHDISRAHFQGTAQRLIHGRLPAEDRQTYGEDKVGRLIKSMHGTQDASHIWQLDFVNLMCGESGGFQRGKHSAALFHNSNEDVRRQCTDTTLCVCQTTMDSLTSTHFSNQKYTAEDMGTLGFEDSDLGEADFHAVVKGGEVGLSLRSIHMDLGIPMKVEIQSDSPTAKSLTDRLVAGPRTEHIDTFLGTIRAKILHAVRFSSGH